ncbi:2OG-Fe(II) oxygenase family oxidoreductase [Hypoxylon cercidicola]|nr:2OG-Fe(II) oxygenase family oxidoreductase [Hypoxylon cercidicola]
MLLVPLSMLMLSVLRCGQFISEHSSIILDWPPFQIFSSRPLSPDSYDCVHSYTIELLSIDPLVIYINDFLSDDEIEHLLDIGTKRLRPSLVTSGSENFIEVLNQTVRQSQTAVLPKKDFVCDCLTRRMQSLLGNVQHMEVEPLQIVKYEAGGDQFKSHMDWFDTPQNDTSYDIEDSFKPSNRLGSIFAYLDDDCTRGETYFPHLSSVSDSADGEKFAIPDGDTGLLVKPRRGNAVFWNNLLPNGSGDARVAHLGLQVDSGTKVGLNMWSRYFLDLPMVGGN